MKFEWIPIGLVVWWSGEVLVRRWLFGQLPTPLGGAAVYGLLVVSLAFATWRVATLIRARRSTLQKN